LNLKRDNCRAVFVTVNSLEEDLLRVGVESLQSCSASVVISGHSGPGEGTIIINIFRSISFGSGNALNAGARKGAERRGGEWLIGISVNNLHFQGESAVRWAVLEGFSFVVSTEAILATETTITRATAR